MNWNKEIYQNIENNWKEFIAKEFDNEYAKSILNFLNKNSFKTIYPTKENVFNAFKFTAPENVKVVILGQDPYHGPGQAHGLSFSVMPGIKRPPSLVNIYKELLDDIGIERENGDLTNWAKQGVLLLNNTLTVFEAKANSHKDIGWNTFTNNVIEYLDKNYQPIFLLWGGFAQKKKKLIKNSQIIEAPHPSPLSSYRGFFGSKPFSTINKILEENDIEKINWK